MYTIILLKRNRNFGDKFHCSSIKHCGSSLNLTDNDKAILYIYGQERKIDHLKFRDDFASGTGIILNFRWR